MKWHARWIWCEGEEQPRNFFLMCRKVFHAPDDIMGAELHITADSRYVLYINGEYIGQGPPRSFPWRQNFDTYDVLPYLRRGTNVIAVLVHHYGHSTFQYLQGRGALLCQLEFRVPVSQLRDRIENALLNLPERYRTIVRLRLGLDDGRVRSYREVAQEIGISGQRVHQIVRKALEHLHEHLKDVRWEEFSKPIIVIGTDNTWRVKPCEAFIRNVPRISVQQAWEEQYDARREVIGWTQPDFDDSKWAHAVEIGEVGCQPWTQLVPRDIPFQTDDEIAPVRIMRVEAVKPIPYHWTIDLKATFYPNSRDSNHKFIRGFIAFEIEAERTRRVRLRCAHHIRGNVKFDHYGRAVEARDGTTVRLRKGINRMLFDISGTHHLLQFTMGLRAHQKLKVRRIVTIGNFTDDEAFKRVWNAGDYRIAPKELIKDVPDYAIANTNVWALTAWDTVAAYPAHLRIENADALLSTNNEWAVIHPCEAKGKDVRLLIDFGQEMLAYIEFEVDAPAGTIIDFNMFEGILDGRVQLTHGLNNSMRYICREGRQRYRSYVKRGFRYMFVVFRNMTAPVKVRYIIARLSTYPMPKRGAFRCSDERLNQIWEVGRRTLQMCMDDTYLDCPAYEQTHWVGDARNEALVNWVVTGDPRITAHCILQTADSLKRSPLPESHVPSGWQNILTAWSLLWIRSIREHWQFTGDGKFLRKIYPALQTTCENLIQYRNKKGLLEIEAWNMLDWAPMDTPSKGVVTHQNMLMVRALREAAEIARTLQHTEDAERWERIADELKHAINEHLWSDERGAFVDCIRADGTLSPVVSQQTNTMALLCDCVDGERAERLRQFILHPPEGVVTAGSPFFLFFLLEQLARDGRAEEMLTLIRDKWGFMLDKGATTFWETIPRTRSWCHAWSAAPTYFLSTVVLGVYPEQPGFSVVGIEPHPVDLKWCHGSMPTPMGDVIVKWERPEVGFKLRAEIPPKLPAHMSLPIYGNAKRIFINGVEALPDKLPEGVDSISITATRIHIYLSRGGVWVVELKE